jgi:hypothetical protein
VLQVLRKGEVDFAVFHSDAFNRIARASANGAEMPQVLACINGFTPRAAISFACMC